ncbi:preprotein translocase subunit SCY1 [Populus alba x Populus x berolinensis]|uniref:Preprotein translocase subunit SCY1 n=1 Tax=Populus alba x Populus x berolinensis TaxID=444605 RepID=A0AAD6PR56_9ROSI|nr:preprotein translocase subunit SCY1 [Populus alba x Populus x berolinensis]
MLLTVREACPCSPISFNLSRINPTRASQRLKTSVCRASFSVQPKPNTKSWNTTLNANSFDPLGINSNVPSSLNASWESLLAFLSPIFESASSTKKDKRGIAVPLILVISSKARYQENFSSFWGFWLYPVLGYIYPLGGVNQEAFAGNLDQNSLLSTLDSLSGGGIGRLGICSLGIVPFINAQIVFQLLAQIYPKLQDLQKREGEAGRKKIFQYTRHASAIGQVLYLRPYVDDFNTQWVLTSVTLLTLGSVFTTYIGERISDLKLGNGTSLLIFTSIISYLPASFGRTAAEAFQDGNYVGLGTIIFSFFLLVLGIVYVQKQNFNEYYNKGFQEAERKIPLNYASRYTSRSGGLQKSAYLPFKVNSSGVMPIIFSTSSLALPGTLARFTGISALKKAALALNPGGSFYLPTNILLIALAIPCLCWTEL